MIDNRLLKYFNWRWYNIIKFTDKRDLVGWLLDYMKQYDILNTYVSIRIAMFRIKDEDFSILEKIYEEYHK